MATTGVGGSGSAAAESTDRQNSMPPPARHSPPAQEKGVTLSPSQTQQDTDLWLSILSSAVNDLRTNSGQQVIVRNVSNGLVLWLPNIVECGLGHGWYKATCPICLSIQTS